MNVVYLALANKDNVAYINKRMLNNKKKFVVILRYPESSVLSQYLCKCFNVNYKKFRSLLKNLDIKYELHDGDFYFDDEPNAILAIKAMKKMFPIDGIRRQLLVERFASELREGLMLPDIDTDFRTNANSFRRHRRDMFDSFITGQPHINFTASHASAYGGMSTLAAFARQSMKDVTISPTLEQMILSEARAFVNGIEIGTLQSITADTPTRNHTVYPRGVLENATRGTRAHMILIDSEFDYTALRSLLGEEGHDESGIREE